MLQFRGGFGHSPCLKTLQEISRSPSLFDTEIGVALLFIFYYFAFTWSFFSNYVRLSSINNSFISVRIRHSILLLPVYHACLVASTSF